MHLRSVGYIVFHRRLPEISDAPQRPDEVFSESLWRRQSWFGSAGAFLMPDTDTQSIPIRTSSRSDSFMSSQADDEQGLVVYKAAARDCQRSKEGQRLQKRSASNSLKQRV